VDCESLRSAKGGACCLYGFVVVVAAAAANHGATKKLALVECESNLWAAKRTGTEPSLNMRELFVDYCDCASVWTEPARF